MSTSETPQETAYFGDIHNHSNISYAHGNIEDAVENAKQRLDFCSVTGHAHWTDIPEPNERIAHIVRFLEVRIERAGKMIEVHPVAHEMRVGLVPLFVVIDYLRRG